MSLPGSNTTADFLQWDQMNTLVQKLERDNKYVFALLIVCGSYTGLRISDLLCLSWKDFLKNDYLCVTEQKTGKIRRIKFNTDLLTTIRSIAHKIKTNTPDSLVFLNKTSGKAFSVQYINRYLKKIRVDYRLNIARFSTHTLRKTFGRHIWQQSGYSEKSITLLSDIFNHSSYRITRRYLGINNDDIDSVYDLL